MNYRLVTIFGGSGFLGGYVVKRLAAQGWRIRVAVRRPQLANSLQPLGTVGQIVPVQANIRDDASTLRAVRDADLVINLVGARGKAGPQSQGSINAQGARRVARLAARAGVPRLIYVSTMGASLDARSHYARSKAHGERFVREQMPQAVILRPSLMFGPGDYFCNRVASVARFLPALPVVDGYLEVQPIYVGDVADALARCAGDGETDAHTYELAGPERLTLRELMALVLREARRERPLVSVPFKAALGLGLVLQYLPMRLLAADDVRQFASPSVPSGALPGLAELGVSPTTLEIALPTYIARLQPSDYEVHTAPG